MSPNRSCWRRIAVGVMVGYCALIAPMVCAEAESIPSLSGYVYLDADGDGSLGSHDWGIQNATVLLLKDTDPTFILCAQTDSNGRYLFDGPAPGIYTGLSPDTYTIKLLSSSGLHGSDTVGTLWNTKTTLPLQPQSLWGQSHNGTDQQDSFTNIQLAADTVGANYNFGELAYPISLVSKALLLSTSSPVAYVLGDPADDGPGNQVPEPASLLLMAIGAVNLAVAAMFRRRRTRSAAPGPN